ncbi:hypothetical protein [Herbidospora cretacea]|uniref:hypothetical protein n=1 Tax=Herbidospora cretacea TaxID=28444 RepID=UPI0004C3FBC6|nr:hypothetical protein [Herbidospora cretacea]
MARRSPARTRPFDEPTPHLSGLSRRGRIALARLEHDRFWPAVSDAYQGWQNLIHDPYRRLFEPTFGCGYILCCPDLSEVNAILGAAVAVLPPRDARRLRGRLREFAASW